MSRRNPLPQGTEMVTPIDPETQMPMPDDIGLGTPVGEAPKATMAPHEADQSRAAFLKRHPLPSNVMTGTPGIGKLSA